MTLFICLTCAPPRQINGFDVILNCRENGCKYKIQGLTTQSGRSNHCPKHGSLTPVCPACGSNLECSRPNEYFTILPFFGGRFSGKTLLIETLQFAYRIQPQGLFPPLAFFLIKGYKPEYTHIPPLLEKPSSEIAILPREASKQLLYEVPTNICKTSDQLYQIGSLFHSKKKAILLVDPYSLENMTRYLPIIHDEMLSLICKHDFAAIAYELIDFFLKTDDPSKLELQVVLTKADTLEYAELFSPNKDLRRACGIVREEMGKGSLTPESSLNVERLIQLGAGRQERFILKLVHNACANVKFYACSCIGHSPRTKISPSGKFHSYLVGRNIHYGVDFLENAIFNRPEWASPSLKGGVNGA